MLMKILVIDESPILRERLIEMLSEINGIEVIGHHAEEQAVLQSLENLKPDALIFDGQISGGRGLAMLRKIKKGKHQPKLFIFSGEVNSAYGDRYLKAGADYFFDKTKELKEMINKISELVQQTVLTNSNKL